MKYTSKRSVLDNLLQRHPQAVEGIMNAGIETNGQELDSEDLKIFFNFEVFLQEGIDSSKNQFDEVNEMTIHKKIVHSNYKILLKNPLVEAFLHIKWQLVDNLFYLNSGCFITFLVMLTLMTILMANLSQCATEPNIIQSLNTTCTTYNKINESNIWNVVQEYISSNDSNSNALGLCFFISFLFTCVGVVLLMVRELIQARVIKFKVQS